MSNSDSTTEKSVAIVMVNWNGWRECIECIDSLFAQNHENFHVFIVDNASTDRSVEHILSWCAAPVADSVWRKHPGVRRLTDRSEPGTLHNRVVEPAGQLLPVALEGCRLTILRSACNLGFAAGCNLGITGAGVGNFDYFWFLNPDTVVHQDALVELLRRATRQQNVGMVGATIRYYDRPDVIQALGGARLNRYNGTSVHIGQGSSVGDVPDESFVERELAYIMGASMLVTSRFISEIGPMEEDYFLYYEEVDWALRASGRFALGFASRSHIFHKSGANSSKAQPLYTSGFYYRNRLRFVARHLPERLAAAKWSLFSEMLRHMAKGRLAHVRLLLSTLLMADRIVADATRRR